MTLKSAAVCWGTAARWIRAVTRAERLAVVTDSNVAPLYLQPVMDSLTAAGFTAFSVVFPAGEASKNIHTLNDAL